MRRGIAALTALAVAWAPCATDWAFVGQAMAQQAAAPAAPATPPADVVFTRAELETLLKPVALYPDPLLAQMLPASAYPLDIVQAARWLDRNKAAVEKNDFSAADTMPWDPSVKALLRFPDLIGKLNENLDWTSDLGDAFVNQPEDVATVIQNLRARAEKGGALKTTPQQTVVKKIEGTREIVYIEPADPEIIFVPSYDPVVVYDPVGPAVVGSLLAFGAGIAVGSIVSNNYWNWRGGVAYPPVWPGYPAFRPPYPGWRPGVTRPPNINIGNDINIGGGNTIIGGGNTIGSGNLVGNSKPWRPDADRYRPGQGSKPGLARPENRPGGAGPGIRPGLGDGQIARPGGDGGGLGGALGGAGAAAIGGAAGGALGGAIAARPGAGGARPNLRPGGGDGPGRPGGGERPNVRPGGGERPTARPTPANRPQARPAPASLSQARPAPASRPQIRPASVKRPQTRPALRPSGFDVRSGAGAAAFGKRGAASRAQIGRPTGGGGVRMPAGGGGGARIGGGGGVRMGGRGGGARAGGGGRRR